MVVAPGGGFYVAGNVMWQRSASSTDQDIFLARVTAGGTLVYTIYLGGDGNDEVGGIAVDQAGRIYVAGSTGSVNFPSLGGVQPGPAGA